MSTNTLAVKSAAELDANSVFNRKGFALAEMKSPAGATFSLVETRTNSAGKTLGTRLHFGANSAETGAMLCEMREALAKATGSSKTAAGKKLAAFVAASKDVAALQARIAIELDLASGKVFERRDENKAGTVAQYRLVQPKSDAAVKAAAAKDAAAQATALADMRKELEALKAAAQAAPSAESIALAFAAMTDEEREAVMEQASALAAE